MPLNDEVVERLRIAREALGLTRSAIERALGWRSPKLWRIESGRQLPGWSEVEEMCDVMGIEIDTTIRYIRPPRAENAVRGRKPKADN